MALYIDNSRRKVKF